MRIRIVLAWTDAEDVDESDPTGLTTAAYERLTGAVNTAGFNVVELAATYA